MHDEFLIWEINLLRHFSALSAYRITRNLFLQI